MELKGKTILIVSPQSWSGQSISKHHYAIELAKLGNKVFFLEPPTQGNKVSIEQTEFNDISVIRHSLQFDKRLRFHFRWLFDCFMKAHLNKILRQLEKIDIVWCFEPNLYKSLDWFEANLRIYHPVDFISKKSQIDVGKSADVIFSVADNILEQFKSIDTPTYFINHGLASSFLNQENARKWVRRGRLKFAYIGSLCIPGLDRKSLKQIIKENREIKFDFFGKKICNEKHHCSFIRFLSNQENVTLHGIKKNEEIANSLNQYDGFLLCYNPDEELNSGSNSHKILEYLSFGKLIVSSKIDQYKEYSHLIAMSEKGDNSDYQSVFNSAVQSIDYWNSEELMNQRRDLAFENTYFKQLKRIESIITDLR